MVRKKKNHCGFSATPTLYNRCLQERVSPFSQKTKKMRMLGRHSLFLFFLLCRFPPHQSSAPGRPVCPLSPHILHSLWAPARHCPGPFSGHTSLLEASSTPTSLSKPCGQVGYSSGVPRCQNSPVPPASGTGSLLLPPCRLLGLSALTPSRFPAPCGHL